MIVSKDYVKLYSVFMDWPNVFCITVYATFLWLQLSEVHYVRPFKGAKLFKQNFKRTQIYREVNFEFEYLHEISKKTSKSLNRGTLSKKTCGPNSRDNVPI